MNDNNINNNNLNNSSSNTTNNVNNGINNSLNDYIKENLNTPAENINNDTFNITNINDINSVANNNIQNINNNSNISNNPNIVNQNNTNVSNLANTNNMQQPNANLTNNSQGIETLHIIENSGNDYNVNDSNVQVISDYNTSENTGSKLKTGFLIIFFIVLLIFVLFLPNISEIINTGNFPFLKNNEVTSGVLVCTMSNSNDITETDYEMRFTFSSKKLTYSTLEVVTESTDKSVINSKYTECQSAQTASENVNGISVNCTSSNSITTNKHRYTYKEIDRDNLTHFTEAGGFYPEYEYQDDIYDIKSKMISNGYDCEINNK